MTPSTQYAEATKGVVDLVQRLSGNDPDAVIYMVARAAILMARDSRGQVGAVDLAHRLADEIAGGVS